MSDIQTTNYPATAKVLVRSENQGRTALGIIQAYCLIHPEATMADINRAFPREKFASTKKLQDTFYTVDEMERVAQAEGDERMMKGVEDIKSGKPSAYYFTLGDGTGQPTATWCGGKATSPRSSNGPSSTTSMSPALRKAIEGNWATTSWSTSTAGSRKWK